ncbi:MAG: glutathione peroxidase [Planctomycetota bacterium]|nr:glutathione peroxidase [Planctomycetota bacterium]
MNMQTASRSIATFLGFGLLVATATALPWQPADAGKPAEPVKGADPAKAPAATDGAKVEPAVADPYILGNTLKDIDGKDQPLAQYKGKVLLLVNVASKCGYTRQYAGLETLHQTYKDQGLVILGIPSNDFGSQEPGTESEIKEFCTKNYKVTFPMFSKIAVTGADANPLYKQLAAQKGVAGGEPKWNFNKYLVDREGRVVEHFDSGVKPEADLLKKKIEALLNAKSAAPAETAKSPAVTAPAKSDGK